ncbi:MAG: DNA translocase FtsK [Clostridia bacterium]|nr:DNA translocase FtsK [Clostridia bacterium]
MAQNTKKTQSKKDTKNGGKTYTVKSRNTKAGAAKMSSAQKKAEELRQKRRNSISAQLTPFILGIVALLLAMFIYLQSMTGAAGGAIGAFFKGVFAGGALAIPPVMGILAFRWRRDAEEGQNGVRIACTVGFIILLSVLLHILAKGSLVYSIPRLWSEGLTLRGGGVIGGLMGTLLWKCFRIAAPIMIVASLIVVTPMLFGLTPRGVVQRISDALQDAKDRYDEEQSERELLRRDREERLRHEREAGVVGYGKYAESEPADRQLTLEDEIKNPPKKRKHKAESFEADVPMPDGEVEDIGPEVDESIWNSVMKEQEEQTLPETDSRLSDKIDGYIPDPDEPLPIDDEEDEDESETVEAVKTSEDNGDTVDLHDIFVSPEDEELLDKLCAAYMTDGDNAEAELQVQRDPVGGMADSGSTAPAETPVQPPKYVFPPLDLLKLDTSSKNPEMKEELHKNAQKLVETLQSFRVKTRVSGICQGPTVTRYELIPEAGTTVSSIENRSNDIGLAFASKGVRIEAPIPGKSAVGIEVPNRVAAIVYLRSLLDSPEFTDAKSKLHAALGEDIAGEAVYLDIAKMPHMLVAGATGMGKSVCINCLIVSLLYRATPDEVKFILIDPKKVEFNLYEGLPHLLVPVVTDPKKAAGSLSWAVSEMERRFNILENARVRDIGKYNSLAKVNEGWEVLPQIVIIIDELADLMMTASDDVEKSIARLAQKARAAGMHLIIGTQRPDVSVITGLIKNNIPSRISCAVTSQVDSRTILDRAGAEKLIGRGDMLYKPVGVDPIRVQGAFVTDSEVEAIVDFIKSQNSEKAEGYSEEVIEQIERAAELCGNSGKKKAAPGAIEDDGDEDPALRAALELAVESRKISTSLIQRKLSLGYGRAAKIIDRMEELGYVSAQDGQKPREVLISKEEFLEMAVKDE